MIDLRVLVVSVLFVTAVAAADTTVLTFETQADAGLAVGRVSSSYVEPAREPTTGARVLKLQFVGGPKAAARPAVFLAARPLGSLPPDWSTVRRVCLRLFNPGSELLRLELEVRTTSGAYTRHALVSSRAWRDVFLHSGDLRDAGVALDSVSGIVLRPTQSQAGQLTEVYLQQVTFDWESKAPDLPPVQRAARQKGPAAVIAPDLAARGYVSWSGMKVPLVGQADVIIAGGGLAGCAAAVAAARRGSSVLLVEQSGSLGGMATIGYVPPAMRPELVGGLVSEFLWALKQRGGPDQDRSPEVIKAVLLGMLRQAGVRVLFYTTAVAPTMNGRSVTGLITHNKAGLQAFKASIVIDCTGDADVAARAGAPFQIGRGRDNLTQAATLVFLLGNVDTTKFPGPHRGGSTEPYVQAAKAAGDWRIPYSGAANCEKVVSGEHGVINVNCVNVGGIDPLDPADLTYAHVQCFDVVWQLVEFFRKYVPGCTDAYLVSSASLIGVRESRRVVGEYILTAQDVLGAAAFEDGIARGFYPIDIHAADSTGDAAGARLRAPYEIPYRCLVPKSVDNLLVAGRPISADHVAHGSLRVMGTTMALGEAAGAAAALCRTRGITPRRLDGRELRVDLERAGALPQIGIRVKDNPALRLRGTTTLADSCHEGYPDSAEGAIDGLVAVGSDSRWVSGESAEPHWIELIFARQTTCSGVTLYFWPPHGQGTDTLYVPLRVNVEARIDSEWRTLASIEPDSVVAEVCFDPVKTRRLRLEFPGGCRADSIVRLREVTVDSP